MINHNIEQDRHSASDINKDAVRNEDRQKRRKNRYRRRKQQVLRQLLVLGSVIVTLMIIVVSCISGKKEEDAQKTVKITNNKKSDRKAAEKETPEQRIARVRDQAHQEQYPENITALLSKNPETVSFVENYGKKKDLPPDEKIEELKAGEIPVLYQWDERWGYAPYGTGCVATSGCGPTCMSMIIAGMANDPYATPARLAAYGAENGYLDEENNTYWKFMSEVAGNWGITARQETASEDIVAAELMSGHPVICSVGPGDFTDNGHFIVLTGYEQGKVTVHDPFSKKNSEKKWVYSEIADQIKAVWIYSRG